MRVFKKLIVLLLLLFVQPIFAEVEIVNRIVAVVNDEIITQQDVEQLLAVLYAQYVHEYRDDELLQKMEDAEKHILGQMIDDKLILSRAKELEIQVREDEIDDKLQYIKDGFPSEKDFYNMLETQGITVANLKDRYRDQIMIKKLVDFEIKSRCSVLPSEIAEYYEIHRSEFKQDERYKVQHILIKAEDNISLDLAKVEIQNVYDKLKEGYDFAELAKEYSEGPNKEEGGDMGYIERGQMLEELENSIFVLKIGEFSESIRSHLGYHIFKVEDIRHSGYLSFEEAQEYIKRIIFQKKFKERLDEWLDGLRKKAYISKK